MPALRVAPHAGAWIEMHAYKKDAACATSRPTRARGLKFAAPWRAQHSLSRAPRGRVD